MDPILPFVAILGYWAMILCTLKLQEEHNRKRSLHGAPRLSVDKALKSDAQAVAEKPGLVENCFLHKPGYQ